MRVALGTAWRATGAGLGIGLLTLLVVGLPTAVIANPWFTRMTPTRPQDYVFLGLTVLLAAAIGASYALPSACSLQEGKLTGGGLLSVLAVGCPVCNKVVVLLLGASGAVAYFEPVQPVLALASIALLGVALVFRLRAIRTAPPRLSERDALPQHEAVR
jgi:hypothetical protein